MTKSWYVNYVIPGTSIHSRDISSEHERSSWIREPGMLHHKNLFFCEIYNTCFFYVGLIVPLFILQLSVTLGILLAYLLGMYVPWRLLAVMGKVSKY
jgi:hypothetical protein